MQGRWSKEPEEAMVEVSAELFADLKNCLLDTFHIMLFRDSYVRR